MSTLPNDPTVSEAAWKHLDAAHVATTIASKARCWTGLEVLWSISQPEAAEDQNDLNNHLHYCHPVFVWFLLLFLSAYFPTSALRRASVHGSVRVAFHATSFVERFFPGPRRGGKGRPQLGPASATCYGNLTGIWI